MDKPLLVVVSGPVGGGKSTVSLALADSYRESGFKAAVIDLDLIYWMSCQDREKWEPENLETARRGVAALADIFYSDGIDIVIIDGEFFDQEELNLLYNNVATEVEYKFVTLKVSFEETWNRVSGDLSRGNSRDSKIFRWLYSQFTNALPFLKASSFIVDADKRTPRDIAELIKAIN
ncbi:hypothetical protein ACFLYN_04155 [Chloroflexota bacterium]